MFYFLPSHVFPSCSCLGNLSVYSPLHSRILLGGVFNLPGGYQICFISIVVLWDSSGANLSLALDPVLNDLPKLIGIPAIGDYPSILAPSIHVTDPFLSTIIYLWKHPFVDFIFLRTCLKASASAIFGNTLPAFGRPCISLEGTSAWAFNETDNIEDVLMDCPMTLTIVEDFRLRLKHIIYILVYPT